MIPRAALAAASLLCALPAVAADLRTELVALQRLDTRVQTAGWRLALGNAAFCRDRAPGIGLQLFDAAGFEDPAAARTALGLETDIAVEAVAAGAPADVARLSPGRALTLVAGKPVAELPKASAGDYARLAGLHDAIDARLRADGAADFAGADGVAVTIRGVPVCPSRFEMLTRGSRAAADGSRVTIGRRLVESLPEDELLAAALAHELAHNLLGHRARLDAQGRSWGKVKATEREADRLMPWLLANAGYDPAAAVRFFERWGPKYDPGILATPDHDGWKERVRRVAAELPAIAAARDGQGKADWRRLFPAKR